ncbi:MAG TPA: ribosome silencing factor [Clostridiales bacterium]|nr:ribosome silencing factor [Clostridiales bacterium]
MPLESKKLALKIGDILKDKKAEDITLLEVYPLTIVADYFIIASGRSETQINSLYRGLIKELANEEIELKGIDGKQDNRWIALDYGDVIVHIFHSEERKFYDLERLWADAQIEIMDNKA